MAGTLTIDQRRERYADEYRRRFDAAKLDPETAKIVVAVAKRVLAGRARYEALSAATGVPWWWIGITHNREGSCNFATHLHNGDPLTARTKNVPAGRPPVGSPPFSFETSAIDALTMPGKNYDRIKVWDLVEVLLRFEQYNGFGYRSQGIPSPYLWAMTNQSNERGKYIRDHVFDPDAPEKQVGCVAVMLALRDLGVQLFPTDPLPKADTKTTAKVTTAAATATVAGAAAAGWSIWEVLALTAAAAVVVFVVTHAIRSINKRASR